ncbi:EXPERA domain-containing protein [Aspergillus clavatus NRRL 1]|uniref:Efficient mitochondria targeting-associated protein 19 n=1 Tax=Aspergillus clavatus (strain ATCC 1007 / CBS 513.65 / DSM 816 / NCTC 3887 / NRRL 1 / QM 1276 / 107) TaxID=344612 RepID=A1CDT8_ASPCL|nr:integral membrane protein, putative [Aspergillus clavatus NRRL 1]EAW12015.1 integral membrane protein, putative [Aspergillus clavatus NRRL 1]
MALSKTPSSVLTRKRDLVYLIFFIIHIPTIFLVDTVPLLPSFLQIDFMHQIRQFYINSYQDKFFSDPPAWFTAFIAMELFYHVPLSIWAVGGLLRDDPLVPVHLLVFGVQAFVTSLACLVDVWSWVDRSVAQKKDITMLYGPCADEGGCGVGAFMALDMVLRLRRVLLRKSKEE